MQKKVFLWALGTLLSFSSFAQINFMKGSWAEVKQRAKKENKVIFMDAYADWCGPCKWMDKNVFADSKVGDYYNQNFISYKLDMEKGEGPNLATVFDVQAYPTLLFIDADENIVYKAVGSKGAEDFIALGEKAKNPVNSLSKLEERYKKGERDPAFVKQFIDALNEAGDDKLAGKIAGEYLETLTNNDLIKNENFNLVVSSFMRLPDAKQSFILNNRSKWASNLGEKGDERINSFFEYISIEKLKDVLSNDKPKSEYADWLTKYEPKRKEEFLAFHDFAKYGNSDDAFQYADKYLSNYCKDWNRLNSYAWQYYEEESDKNKLKAALKWGLKSVEIERNFYNLDTVAHLYYKLGDNKQAKKYALEAIEKGKVAGEDISGTQALVDKL